MTHENRRLSVTVVVAARNEAATIANCITSIRRQEYPIFDVIVADDGSSDDTADRAERAGARVLRLTGGGPSKARNLAVSSCASEIVAFTDADCVAAPGWLTALVEGFDESTIASVGGRQQNVFDYPHSREARALDAFFRASSMIAEYTRSSEVRREVDHNASCNSAYRRDVFVASGGFSEDLWPGEDVDLDYRLRRNGYRCVYAPGAVVFHHRRTDLAWWRGMMRRYGRAQCELVRRYGRFRPLHWVPVATGVFAATQLLWTARRPRPFIAALDGTLALAAAALLARNAPPDIWPTVVAYAAAGTAEWLRGYSEGLRA